MKVIHNNKVMGQDLLKKVLVNHKKNLKVNAGTKKYKTIIRGLTYFQQQAYRGSEHRDEKWGGRRRQLLTQTSVTTPVAICWDRPRSIFSDA